MRFYNLTFVLVLAYYGYIFSQSITHATYGSSATLCGPFLSDIPAKTPIIDAITSTTVTAFIWNNFVYYAPFMWLIAILFYTKNAFNGNYLALSLNFIAEKEDEYTKKIDELRVKNMRMAEKLKMRQKLDD